MSDKRKIQWESDKEIENRIWKLTNKQDYGICPPPIEAKEAFNEIARYILGDEFFISRFYLSHPDTDELYISVILNRISWTMKENFGKKYDIPIPQSIQKPLTYEKAFNTLVHAIIQADSYALNYPMSVHESQIRTEQLFEMELILRPPKPMKLIVNETIEGGKKWLQQKIQNLMDKRRM